MHDVTEVQRRLSQCSHVIQPYDPEKYHTVGLHTWQRQKFGGNIRIKLFIYEYEIGFKDIQPNYLGF
jgi:hypothetical protein